MLRSLFLMAALFAVAGCGSSRYDSGADTRRTPSATAERVGSGAVVVRRGDSLYKIARRHGVPLRDLITFNRLRPPYEIYPGQRLRLPRAKAHVVRRGDTVGAIAKRYGVSLKRLASVNRIEPPYRIYPGQTLRLPGAKAAAGTRVARRPASPGRVKSKPPKAVALARPPPRAGKRFLWPVDGPVAVGFGVRGKGLRNDGINILARRGTGVRAAENGVVAYSGNAVRGFGNLVLIKHAGGWMSAYAHNEVLLVRTGQRVRRGETISRVGSTGNVSKPQLHFELRRGRRAVDPLRYLTPARRTISFLIPRDPEPRRVDPPGPG